MGWFGRRHQEAKVSKRGKMHTGIEKTDEVHKSARTFQLNTWNFWEICLEHCSSRRIRNVNFILFVIYIYWLIRRNLSAQNGILCVDVGMLDFNVDHIMLKSCNTQDLDHAVIHARSFRYLYMDTFLHSFILPFIRDIQWSFKMHSIFYTLCTVYIVLL